MDVGPRPCWFDPGNSGKGFPAMSFSEPLAASIENTSTWLSTLSRAYRKLSGPSTASAVARPFVTDVPMGVRAPDLVSDVYIVTRGPDYRAGTSPRGEWAPGHFGKGARRSNLEHRNSVRTAVGCQHKLSAGIDGDLDRLGAGQKWTAAHRGQFAGR